MEARWNKQTLDYQSQADRAWTRHEVAALVLKVLGIYAILNGVAMLSYVPAVVQLGLAVPMELMFGMAPFIIFVAGGIVMLAMGNRLAYLLLSPPAGTGISLPRGSELQAMAFAVIGVILVARALPSLAQLTVLHLYPPPGIGVRDSYAGDFLSVATQIIVGLLLFLRSHGLAVLWHRLRTAGVEKAS